MKPITVCFGEMLWDCFPNGSREPGGAPMNVAYHFSKLGMDSHIISRTGADEPGADLLKMIRKWGIPLDTIQQDSQYPTGTVQATMGADNEMHYDILRPVAWDFIEWQPGYETLLRNAGAFVFGSLAIRNEVSRNTLFKLLEIAPYKVFDINIRPPHSNMDIIRELLHRVDLVKMNLDELKALLAAEGITYVSPMQGAQAVTDRFQLPQVIVTRGSKGALYFDKTSCYDRPARQVTVKDTVGSGDSFLAGFLTQGLRGKSLDAALDLAIEVSGFVTTQEGGCPEYDKNRFYM